MVTWQIYELSRQMANIVVICLVSGTLPSYLHLEPFTFHWGKAEWCSSEKATPAL